MVSFTNNPEIKENQTITVIPLKVSNSLIVIIGVSSSFDPAEILKWFGGNSDK